MKAILILCGVLLLSGCAGLVEKCSEFSKYVDIKAIDCAGQEVKAPETPEKK